MLSEQQISGCRRSIKFLSTVSDLGSVITYLS
jgi:hypothetical protein